MNIELTSVQGYEQVVRAFLAAGRREQALVAFAQLMHAHPSSAATRALLIELFAARASEAAERNGSRAVKASDACDV